MKIFLRVLAAAIVILLVGLGLAPLTKADEPAPPPVTSVSHLATKVVVSMIENHSPEQIRSGMPQTTALADQFAHGNGSAFRHPSKPNYLGTWSGDTQKETSDRFAIESAPSYFDSVPAGQAKTYAQSMGSDRCRIKNRGAYVVKHNPHALFIKTKAKRAVCEKYNFDGFGAKQYWKNDLINDRLGVINHLLPDDAHNWHDIPKSKAGAKAAAKRADDFFSARITEFLASKAYQDGAVLIITADEDNRVGANDVPIMAFHKSLEGTKLDAGNKLSLVQLSAFIADVAHVKALGRAKGHEGEFAKAFNLTTVRTK